MSMKIRIEIEQRFPEMGDGGVYRHVVEKDYDDPDYERYDEARELVRETADSAIFALFGYARNDGIEQAKGEDQWTISPTGSVWH